MISSIEELKSFSLKLYSLPLFELIAQAHEVHRTHHSPSDIQKCVLLSVKTGGCPEDCAYCPQSAHYEPGRASASPLLDLEQVQMAARKAKEQGAERFCMGAAWRGVREGPEFERILNMIRAVKAQTRARDLRNAGPTQARSGSSP